MKKEASEGKKRSYFRKKMVMDVLFYQLLHMHDFKIVEEGTQGRHHFPTKKIDDSK